MDKRSFYSAMHKSMDSPLTGRLPTPCPQPYAQRLCLLRYKRTRKMRQIMIKTEQKPVSMYAYHLPNETHRYGILIIIGTTIWLILRNRAAMIFMAAWLRP